jgi:hypothetical protein
MNSKKAISTGILIFLMIFSTACRLHVEDKFADAQAEAAKENTSVDICENPKAVFEKWGDFSNTLTDGDEKVDFGMSVTEVVSQLGKNVISETENELIYVPDNDVLFFGWRVSRQRYLFSKDHILYRADMELEFVGNGEAPDTLHSELERSFGVPAYESGMKWDDARGEWISFQGNVDVANTPAYFESQWKTRSETLVYRQFGTKLLLSRVVLGYPTVGVFADDTIPELIDPDTELHLGNFVLGMEESAFWKILGEEPSSVYEEKDPGAVSTRTCRFSGGEVVFIKSEFAESDINKPYSLYSISLNSPEYKTRRGLSPLDTVIRLIELYGFPEWAYDDVWRYGDGGYEFYQFTIKNDIVMSINLHYSL